MPTHAQELFNDPVFAAELGADPELLADFFDSLDQEANDNENALGALDALQWIARQPRTISEKARAVTKVMALRGEVRISSARAFLGW